MKPLKFRKDLAKMILEGEKTSTWRLFDDKNLTVGDQLELISWETGKVFAQAEITTISEKKFGEISEPDYLGHERFESPAEMLNHYRDFYGQHVTMETPMKIVDFTLLSSSTPGTNPVSQ